ncbi:teneurin-3-like [Saccoglossus kowalevskii]
MTYTGNYRVRSVKTKAPSSVGSGSYVIPGPNPSEVFIFNRRGQHLRTFDLKRNRILYEFHYNDDDSIKAVSDSFNNTLDIERSSDGKVHAIIAANGERTVIGKNEEGMMNYLSDPSNGATRFEYQNGGLLRGTFTPQGYNQYLAYDESGRVFAQYDNLGRRELYGNFQGTTSSTKTTYSSMNRKQSIETEVLSGQVRQIFKTVNGIAKEILSNLQDGSSVTTSADGTKVTKIKSPHPVWGTQISQVASTKTTLPSGLEKRLDVDHFASQLDPDDPLSVMTMGKHIKINGEEISTSEYRRADRTSTITVGNDVIRRSVNDVYGREIIIQRPSMGLADIVLQYNGTSSEVKVKVVDDLWQTYEYDIFGNILSEARSSGFETRYEYAGRDKLSKLVLPSGRTYELRYDDQGNLASIAMPSGSEHFLRTRIRPRARDEIYRSPLSLHSSFMSTYNLDGDLIQTLYPTTGDVSHWYDDAYRPTAVYFNDVYIEFEYKDNSDRVTSMNRYDKSIKQTVVKYEYDGFLPTSDTMIDSDEVISKFQYTYNSEFLLEKIDAFVYGRTTTLQIQYDRFGDYTKYGSFNVAKVSPMTEQITDSTISCDYSHDQHGRPAEFKCQFAENANFDVFRYKLHYNNDSLITERIYTIFIKGEHVENRNTYVYDVDGQLSAVKQNGMLLESYEYDINGNRVEWGGIGDEPQHSAIYDEADIIKQHDTIAYVFSDDGFLNRKGSTVFTYNARGELERAFTPGSFDRRYKYDALSRRIQMTDVESGDSARYVYGNPGNVLQVTHVIHGEDDTLVTLYYNQLGHLFSMVTDDVTYYVMCDHLGTPLVVVDSSGRLHKLIRRDAYGAILFDSNPDFFLPIGYAGGIYDHMTQLTRFHYRDYDATIGRWTARDPSFYSSQQPNLYQYVFNDPINLRDPLGLACIGASFYNGWGGGAEFCFDHTGASVCVEGGAGVGGFSHELNSGGPKKGLSVGVFAEGGISIPGVMSHSFGGSYDLINPIDWDEGKINPCMKTDWDVNYKRSYGPTSVKCGTGGCDVGTALKPEGVSKNPKLQKGFKAGAKVCYGR